MQFLQNKTHILTSCALMLAAATALSFVKVFEMPLGGSITLASTVPIAILAYRYGAKIGFAVSFLYGFVQLLLGLKNLSYGQTLGAVIAIVLFDYIIAFGALGIVAFFRIKKEKITRKEQTISFCGGLFVALIARFLCHFGSGVVVWYSLTKEWYTEPSHLVNRAGAYFYSFVYNISYMAPELLVSLVFSVLICSYINFSAKNLRF